MSNQQVSSLELVEEALQGIDPITRDQARATLVRSGNTRELEYVINALFASLDTTRRRATRLLSDLQPHRVIPLLRKWVNRQHHGGFQCENGVTSRAYLDSLVSAARLLNQLTVRGEEEESLALLLEAPYPKVKRAAICPATPVNALLLQLNRDEEQLVCAAYEEILLRMERVSTLGSELGELLQTTLSSFFSNEDVTRSVEMLSEDGEPSPTLQYRTELFAQLFPEHPVWEKSVLNGSQRAILLCRQPEVLAELLSDQVKQVMDGEYQTELFTILLALERAVRSSDRQFLITEHMTDCSISTLCQADRASFRALIARLLPRGDQHLLSLQHDEDAGVRWCAQRRTNGAFSPLVLQARLGRHERLTLPSARPPYGLRAFDHLPEVQRVSGALALCQARFDVNLGVAMRSAEAAGLSEIFIIGARSGSLSSARGAEYALPITWLRDDQELITEARRRGYQLVAIQQTLQSQPYHLADYPPNPLFIVGSEDMGLSDELRVAADLAVEIPLYGLIDSLNVSTAATCVMMHWRVHLD